MRAPLFPFARLKFRADGLSAARAAGTRTMRASNGARSHIYSGRKCARDGFLSRGFFGSGSDGDWVTRGCRVFGESAAVGDLSDNVCSVYVVGV